MKRRLLLVDDSAGFLAAARLLLTADGFDVIAMAADGYEAVREATRLVPDVVVVDIGLPDIDGFEVARQMTRLRKPPAVVLVSSHDWSDRITRVRASGACGFLAKEDLDGPAIARLIEGRP